MTGYMIYNTIMAKARRGTYSILTAAAMAVAAMLVSCNEETPEPAQTGTATISIPLSVEQSFGTETRAEGDPGDPGYDPRPEVPTYLYIWACVDYNQSGPCVLFQKIESPAWNYTDDGDYPDDRYVLQDNVVFDCGREPFKANSDIYIYAIAARNSLDDALTGFTSEKWTGDHVTDIEKMTLDLDTWAGTSAKEHSDALRNLYSTPLALKGQHTIETNKDGIVEMPSGKTVRLYHCAARVDMKWEVAAYDIEGKKDYDATLALQKTTAVKAVTLTGLPTELNVFTPTANPAGTGTCVLAGDNGVNKIDGSNKWIGREVAYVLQPPTTAADTDGQISYTVDMVNPTDDTDNWKVNTSTPAATNPTYTTWYRVQAKISR